MTRRAEGLTISWYPEDREALRADAKRAGLSVSAYLRGLWLAARRRGAVAEPWSENGAGVWAGHARARIPSTGRNIANVSVGDDGTGWAWRVWLTDTQKDEDAGGTAATLDDAKAAADAWLRSRGVVLA